MIFLWQNFIGTYNIDVYVYVWLPWLRFFRAFSSVVRQMPGQNPQRRGTARTLPSCCVALCIFFCCSMYFLCSLYCLFCDVSCIVWVYMCTEQLPPGGYPIAVKYISYHKSGDGLDCTLLTHITLAHNFICFFNILTHIVHHIHKT